LRNCGEVITKDSLKTIALEHAARLLKQDGLSDAVKKKYQTAKFGEQWQRRFVQSQGFRQIRINGERADLRNIDISGMADIKSRIPALRLDANDVYNIDETALFYRARPVYTLAQRNDSGAECKIDKSRLTLVIRTNGDGSDRFLIK
jgi:hypothetical protein